MMNAKVLVPPAEQNRGSSCKSMTHHTLQRQLAAVNGGRFYLIFPPGLKIAAVSSELSRYNGVRRMRNRDPSPRKLPKRTQSPDDRS